MTSVTTRSCACSLPHMSIDVCHSAMLHSRWCEATLAEHSRRTVVMVGSDSVLLAIATLLARSLWCAMSDEGGGRGSRGTSQACDQHTMGASGETAPAVGRRTLVENAPTGAPPLRAEVEGDDGQARTE